MNRTRLGATWIASLLLIAASFALIDSESRDDPATVDTRVAKNGQARTSETADGPAVSVTAASSVLTPAPPERAEVEAQGAPAALSCGTLQFSVIDPAEPSLQIDFHARLLAPDWFAELDRTSTLAETLAAGTYAGVIRVRGYEPIALQDVVIAPDAVTTLGTLDLERGSARISGRVDVPMTIAPYESTSLICVELRGSSRSPCDRCSILGASEPVIEGPIEVSLPRYKDRLEREARCDVCGYSNSVSTFYVAPETPFVFEHLASGHYRLRAWNPDHDVIGTEIEFTLRRGESRYLPIRLAATADLVLEFRSAETGAPISGHQRDGDSTRLRIFSIHAEREDGISFDMSYMPPIASDPHDGTTLFTTGLMVENFRVRTAVSFTVGGIGSDIMLRRALGIEDGPPRPLPAGRSRTADDVLDPIDLAPHAEIGSPRVEAHGEAHRCVIRELPTGNYRITVTVENLIAKDLEVFVPNFGEQYLLVPLRQRTAEDEVDSPDMIGGTITFQIEDHGEFLLGSRSQIEIELPGSATTDGK